MKSNQGCPGRTASECDIVIRNFVIRIRYRPPVQDDVCLTCFLVSRISPSDRVSCSRLREAVVLGFRDLRFEIVRFELVRTDGGQRCSAEGSLERGRHGGFTPGSAPA